MSKDRNYRRLVSSTRWQKLALRMKTKAGWRCSECGRVTQRLAVHHVQAVEDTTDTEEMERRCYDENNLQVLCYDCHKRKHEYRQGTHQERERQRVERMKETMKNLNENDGIEF